MILNKLSVYLSMKKLIYILFLVFLFGCSNANDQLQKENLSLKIEIDSLYCEIDSLNYELEITLLMAESNAQIALKLSEQLKNLN